MRTSKTPHALMLGAAIGFVFAVLPSCGPVRTPTRCSASNCDGCCDETGTCQSGSSTEACGKAGATCAPCAAGQTCAQVDQADPLRGGQCVTGGSGGGSANTGGGTANTGGGTANTGGGSANTGGGTGNTDGGACGPSNCASGCCTTSGVCITTLTPSRCGTGGAVCSSCMMGNTCSAGACTPCSGCININTGVCETGTQNAACGKSGGFCQACDQSAGQICQAGTCGGGSVCNASTCQGCCDGNTCKLPAQYTTAQCGQGTPGAACISCVGAQTCDAMGTGACAGNAGTGGGGGGIFPGLDGGGFPNFDLCSIAGRPCQTGDCCDVDGIIGVIPTCYAPGRTCGDPTTTCQSSGVCQ